VIFVFSKNHWYSIRFRYLLNFLVNIIFKYYSDIYRVFWYIPLLIKKLKDIYSAEHQMLLVHQDIRFLLKLHLSNFYDSIIEEVTRETCREFF
jgi:hypothetical protein